MERFTLNGTAAQLANRDAYGIFSTLFRDKYFFAEIGEVGDDELQRIVSLFGAPWHRDAAVMTIEKTSEPRFIGQTDQMIPAHNECAYMPRPPRLLALYCVENLADDGAFFSVSPDTLLDGIGHHYLTSLMNAEYDCAMFENEPSFRTTLARQTAIGPQLIFTSIGAMTGDSVYTLANPVDEWSDSLLPRVTEWLNHPGNRQRHLWRKGDLVVIDNFRLLHGRESFSGGDRILRHLRLA